MLKHPSTRLILLVTVSVLSLWLNPIGLNPAHATGSLFINPSNQPNQPVGTIIAYQVKVSGMDPLNGWDIAVTTPQSILNPINVTIAGNFISPTGQEGTNCVNGGTGIPIGQPGDIGCTISDGPGIIHSAVVFFNSSPTSGNGLLLTIHYEIATDTFTQVQFSKDILVSSGSIVSHTSIGASYGILPGTPPTAEFTWTPAAPQVDEQVTFDASTSHDDASNQPSGIALYRWDFGDTTRAYESTLPTAVHVFSFGTSSAVGSFVVTLQVKNQLGLTSSAVHTVVVTPRPSGSGDFTIGCICESIPRTIPSGSSDNTTWIVTSVNSFVGTVQLTASVTPLKVSGPAVSITPNNVALDSSISGHNGFAKLSFSTAATTSPGAYVVTVTGASTIGITHSTSLILVAAPFSLDTTPGVLIIPDAQSGQSIITLKSINGFSGNLNISAVGGIPCGCIATLNPTHVLLMPGGVATAILTVSVADKVPPLERPIPVRVDPQPYSPNSFYMVRNVIMKIPLLQPVFTGVGLSWARHVSPATNHTQVWVANVTNPNGGTSVVLSVHVDGVGIIDGTPISFKLESPFVILAPRQTVQIMIIHQFTALHSGVKFHFMATILWGLPNGTVRGQVSTDTRSGSFAIVGVGNIDPDKSHG